MISKFRKMLFAPILIIGLFALAFASFSAAASQVDPGHQASLTVECCYDGMPLEGVEFGLFKAADMDADGILTAAGDFIGYSIDFDQHDSQGWRALALTLSAYVQRDGITPYRSVSSDASGNAFFSELSVGLYLVCGSQLNAGDFTYTPEPFLVIIPQQGENNELCYDVCVSCKGEGNENEPENIDISVIKVWDDQSSTAVRPQSITVQLLCDGEIFDSVVLSEDNGWRHTWQRLESSHSWLVVEEEVPSGYTLIVSKEGWTFILTNSAVDRITELYVQKIWVDEGNEENRPHSITVKLLCDGKVFDTVLLGEETGWQYHWTGLDRDHSWSVKEDNVPAGYYAEIREDGVWFYIVNTYKTIPQTGQLWWPVPVFVCLGLMCFAVAVIRRKNRLS